MGKRIKVYTASCLNKGPLWRELASVWEEVEIVARWPFLHVNNEGLPDWPEDCPAHGAEFWQQDHDDVLRADVVLIYAIETDELRGALVESGMALGLGKPVIVAGKNHRFGTWQYHRLARRVPTLEAARSLLRLMSTPASV